VVSDVSTAPLQTYLACNRVILLSEAFAVHEKWMRERPQDYGQLARERLMGGAFIRAADYVNATRLRRKLAAEFHALFDQVDVIVTSSSMDPPCRIDDAQAIEFTYGRQSRAPFNITGSPGLAVPTGFTRSGLPLGMQLVGKPLSEALLYRVAYAYEQSTSWSGQHPALA
jgi:aspartyl-tRNA(Asn)/glutamyl-tRNA(Gln) amidotransferase subunit A